MMRTREFWLSGLEWDQFGALNAGEVANDELWLPVLLWLKGLYYALIVGDLDQKQKRAKIDIDSTVKKKEQPPWVGPQRYYQFINIFLQRERAIEEGINCQVAVHIVAKARGITLSGEVRSGELFEHYRLFDPTEEQLEVGDIVFFYERPEIVDARSLHVTTCVGFDMGGVPLLLHATNQAIKTRPAAEIIPITQLLTNRQRFCYGAVRLN